MPNKNKYTLVKNDKWLSKKFRGCCRKQLASDDVGYNSRNIVTQKDIKIFKQFRTGCLLEEGAWDLRQTTTIWSMFQALDDPKSVDKPSKRQRNPSINQILARSISITIWISQRYRSVVSLWVSFKYFHASCPYLLYTLAPQIHECKHSNRLANRS